MSASIKSAVVLLSGGMDSAVTLAEAIFGGFRCAALSFDYGQRHRFELEAAKKIARSLGVADHRLLELNLREFGGSALTAEIEVPKDGGNRLSSAPIPITYVPARNTIFLSCALALAEVTGAADIFIGVNALDYSGYPDCRPEYIDAFQRLANLATKAAVSGEATYRVQAPLMKMSKSEIVKRGLELGVDFSLTHSCYDPSPEGLACGRCDSCRLRLKGFSEAGVKDPAIYFY
jgi:7-cyano-7-deazaguanine synthase